MISKQFLALVIILKIENPKQNNIHEECYGKYAMTTIHTFILSQMCWPSLNFLSHISHSTSIYLCPHYLIETTLIHLTTEIFYKIERTHIYF